MARAQPDMFSGMEAVIPPSPVVIEAQEIWNLFAEKNKWKKCVVLDKARKATIARAVGDYGGILGWRKALETVERSRFVMGKVPPREGTGFKQFQARIDWFCQARTIRQVFEDFYEDDGGQNGVGPSKPLSQGIDWRGTLERYKPRGFWHKDTMGPRPEEPGPHKVPADMLEAWRKKHGITGVQAPTETREQRLAASIATFRRLGDYARANAAEEQLATLQGRPSELVPAPDARNPDVMPPKMPYNKDYYGHTAKNGGNYSKPMQRSEAEITRAMAGAQDTAWEDIPEGENYGRDE